MLKIEIKTGNDVFYQNYSEEIGRLLSIVKVKIQTGIFNGLLKDKNGNTVGFFEEDNN